MKSCLFMMNTAHFDKMYGVVSFIVFSNVTEWDDELLPHKYSGLFWPEVLTLTKSPHISL